MSKTIKVLIILISLITLLTILADSFSYLSNTWLQYLIFITAIAIILTGIYFLLKIKKS